MDDGVILAIAAAFVMIAALSAFGFWCAIHALRMRRQPWIISETPSRIDRLIPLRDRIYAETGWLTIRFLEENADTGMRETETFFILAKNLHIHFCDTDFRMEQFSKKRELGTDMEYGVECHAHIPKDSVFPKRSLLCATRNQTGRNQ